MLNLKRVFKNYEETGSLNTMINLFGFIGPKVFLTKSGDAGIVLELGGVDYEYRDAPEIDALTKRLESALRLFDEKYRVYQFLFKFASHLLERGADIMTVKELLGHSTVTVTMRYTQTNLTSKVVAVGKLAGAATRCTTMQRSNLVAQQNVR